MSVKPFNLKGNLLAIRGRLFKFPTYIANIFGSGWDRNRVIDSIGNHGNALMGSYLLASSNLTISISGLLKTDTLVALTTDGLVGNISSNGVISFITGQNYGAFEVFRGTVLIGRFCLTERQGSRLINQVTGTLGNGLLGGTLTTAWQLSNAFYSETNTNGYSISATGWVTNNGEALTIGTLIPSDLSNPTKCLAWVGVVQQDLQFVGKAKNSVSLVPYGFYCNGDRYWNARSLTNTDTRTIEYTVYYRTTTVTTATMFLVGQSFSTTHALYIIDKTVRLNYANGGNVVISDYILKNNTSYKIVAGVTETTEYVTVIELNTGIEYTTISANGHGNIPREIFVIGASSQFSSRLFGYIGLIRIAVNGTIVRNYIPDQNRTSYIDTVTDTSIGISGVSTNLFKNIDLGYNVYLINGYEIWTNGTDYQIYPLNDNGNRFITPAGYTLVETVESGNMPSVADARFTTFQYALANSYEVRNIVPEAYNTDAQSTPKLLTYNELKDLGNNPKVRITENNNKITNLKIKL